MVFITVLVWFVAIFVAIATLLPLSGSVRWWVRAWEFPRQHFASIAVIGLTLALVFPIDFRLGVIAILLPCAIYQSILVFPYTPFAATEVSLIGDVPEASKIKLLSANVLMENTRKTDLARIIERENPDVLLLMETDQSWMEGLRDCLAQYPTVLAHPLDNHYGLVFATRLHSKNFEIAFLSDDNTPSLRAELIGPDGTGFNFIGLHPRPPVPGNDTRMRDEQIKKAAQMAGNANWPTVCMGDFNDVAWSWTSKRFKRYGGFLEPRIGRGMFSTFHAQYPLASIPIDQLFLTKGIGLVSFGRLEEFGSDHFPVTATISFHKAASSD